MTSPQKDQEKIEITLDGGLIQDIIGIPRGVAIIVRDYDVDGMDEAELERDKNDVLHYVSYWS